MVDIIISNGSCRQADSCEKLTDHLAYTKPHVLLSFCFVKQVATGFVS